MSIKLASTQLSQCITNSNLQIKLQSENRLDKTSYKCYLCLCVLYLCLSGLSHPIYVFLFSSYSVSVAGPLLQYVFTKSKKGSAKQSQNWLENVADTYAICFIKVSIKSNKDRQSQLKIHGDILKQVISKFLFIKIVE